jgi:hypothetical protein
MTNKEKFLTKKTDLKLFQSNRQQQCRRLGIQPNDTQPNDVTHFTAMLSVVFLSVIMSNVVAPATNKCFEQSWFFQLAIRSKHFFFCLKFNFALYFRPHPRNNLIKLFLKVQFTVFQAQQISAKT